MPEIQREGFPGQQMHRNRVARKGVHSQHVEILRRFAFERQPRIARRDLDARRRIAQKRELASGDGDHLRIDFVEMKFVARLAIGAESARAQADRAARLPPVQQSSIASPTPESGP